MKLDATGVDGAPPDGMIRPQTLGLLLIAAGLLGAAAALGLGVEKFRLLENPLYVPACSINEAVDCGSVMRSPQAQTFGIPNPFLGLAAFPALALLGLQLAAGGVLARPVAGLLQAGLTAGALFVHWLAFQSLYRIGALCPFCIAVWFATIPAFWYVTLTNLGLLARRPTPAGRVATALRRNHAVGLTAWLLVLAALVLERFWSP